MKTKRKMLAALLSLAMVVNVFTPAISANELADVPETPAPTAVTLPVEAAPETSAPTAAPEAPAEQASPTPAVSAAPAASTEDETNETVEPTETPAEPAAPAATPVPSAAPAAEPEEEPAATQVPAATLVPAASAEPEAVQQSTGSNLYERLMACTTAADFDAAANAATDEEIAAITPAQDAALDAKYDALHANDVPAAPAVPADPAEEPEPVDVPVESEVIVPSRNVTDVAPFLEPVTGFAADPLRTPYRMTAPLFYAAGPERPEGVELDKIARANGDGTYTITLETYATGAKIITEETTSLPTDIVLVLDQSASMKNETIDKITWESYRQNTNAELYDQRHNGGAGNLYYPVDGRYYSVSVERKGVGTVLPDTYTPVSSWSNEDYYNNQSNLYAYLDGRYVKVTVEREGRSWSRSYLYTANGETIGRGEGDSRTPEFTTDDGRLYRKTANSANQYSYTYSYTLEGKNIPIVTSEGNTSQPKSTFYHKNKSGSEKRMEALVRALRIFTDEVEKKAMGADGTFGTDDDVHHRIAMVGFAGKSASVTGLFVPETNGDFRKVRHDQITSGQYQKAFMDMADDTGRKTVQNIIKDSNEGVRETAGMTNSQIGMEVAGRVLQNNPVPEGEERSRVVILFTDGVPEENGTPKENKVGKFNKNIAAGAVAAAKNIKEIQHATVYTVGVFEGADATEKGLDQGKETETGCANQYMQDVSSNNGVPRNPSYYLSAADAESLNEIFALISQQIEEGGASTKLDEKAVIRDVIAESFQLPAGATKDNIKLETYRCTGVHPDGTYTWEPNHDAMGAKATITKGNQVNVTGFDFAENYVGTVTQNGAVTYRGNKLVISFEVVAKPGFLGGNKVPTNQSAGLYEKADSQKPVAEYPVPVVDVPVAPVEVIAPSLYVYLHGSLKGESAVQAKAGGQLLDLTRKDLGLQPWQLAYVNLKFTDGTQEIVKAEQDTSYTCQLEITPKYSGTYAPTQAKKTGQIYVVKPTITWQDSQIQLGETADYAQQNFVRTDWLHKGEPVPAGQKIFGTKPELTDTFHPGAAAFTQDTLVKVTVQIGQEDVTRYTTFRHTDCTFDGCKWGQPGFTAADGQFIVHIKSFDLTITKTGCQAVDENQSFRFDISGPNGYRQSVVIHGNESVTIRGLPAGEYTITEDTGWSGRYTPQVPAQRVSAADATDGRAQVTFSNQRTESRWLDFNTGVENLWKGTETIRQYVNGVLVSSTTN